MKGLDGQPTRNRNRFGDKTSLADRIFLLNGFERSAEDV
jgi:hypothetical protein